MRIWQRAKARLSCGAKVGCQIPEGAAYLLLKGDNWQKVRCEAHAGSAVPADIDTPKPSTRPASGFTQAKDLVRSLPKVLRFDAKLAQAGKDE